MNSANPIGVFDSGVGGLSVLREIRQLLPREDLIYIADSAHVPYGNKSDSFILERSRTLTQLLLEQGAKAIVVACNTATAAAVTSLREEFAVPIIAMEPAVKPAVSATRSGVVGVLATTGTLASARFAALLERYGNNARIITQPCPGLVEQVEAGKLEHPETHALLDGYIQPLLSVGADTLILGCTHYPFLRDQIARIAGPQVTLIDTGRAVAAQLLRSLTACGLLADGREAGTERFWTSTDPGSLAPTIKLLWSADARMDTLPDIVATA